MTRARKKTHTKKPVSPQPALEEKTATPSPLKKITAPLLCIVMVAIYYWPILTAKGWLWNDFLEQNFPYRLFAAINLKKGILPFWNPYVFSGMPFFADVQAAVLYPLNLLLTPFASSDWLSPLLVEYQIIAHYALAGIFMFMLCRDFKLSKSASIAGAVTFMFCAFLNTHIFHVNLVHTAVWFPLIVLLFRRLLNTKRMIYAGACALVLAAVFLAGYPQLMLHMYYWLGAFFLYLAILRLRTHKSNPKTESHRGALFAAVVILSLGMTAVQFLPTNELGMNSARPTLEFRQSCEGSFRPYRFITLLVPNFLGKPDNSYWGIGANDVRPGMHSYWETAIYCGILPLILAALAAVFVRTPIVWFLSGMAILSFLLAMGDSFFFYWIFYTLLPGFNRFRIPGRFAFMFSFSIAILAAYGLQWLINNSLALSQQTKKRIINIFIGIVAISVLFAILAGSGGLNGTITAFLESSGKFGNNTQAIERFVAQRIAPSLAGPSWIFALFCLASLFVAGARISGRFTARYATRAAIAIIFLDLLVFQYGSAFPFSQPSYASSGRDPGAAYAKTPLVKQLLDQLEREYFRINSRDSNPGTTDLGGRNMIFQKNQGSVHQMFLMEGYNPLRLKRQLIDRRKKGLDILNIKYAIHVDQTGRPLGFALNSGYFPRARMVYDYQIVADEDKILESIWNDNFNHAKTIILENSTGIAKCDTCDSLGWNASISSYGLNEIVVDVTTPRDGFLVLSEIHYPYWKASVDGQPALLHRADYALRAIEVPAGKHTVRCFYQSSAFAQGALISVLCLIAAIALCAYDIWFAKKAKAEAA